MINEFRGKYYFLSNFFEAPVTWDGVTYQNNEAAFQSAKVLDKSVREKFSTLDPSSAKRKGRSVQLRHDWEKVKYDIMYEICLAKFSQNEDLKAQLLSTGDAVLAECAVNDHIWGIGLSMHTPDRFDRVKWKGQNLLGYTLMMVRQKLS